MLNHSIPIGLEAVGGWSGLVARLDAVAVSQHYVAGTWTDSWKHMGSPSDNPMGVEWFGMVMGLGFVLSFGYWCTDFLVVQRAMAAKSMSAARRTPLIAAFPKMLFPVLVILPGMIAVALMNQPGSGFQLPIKDGSINYTMTVPRMLFHFFPEGLLGLGLTALMASFMSGMAGNVTAFNTVWTYDIYQSYIAPNRSDNHYLWMGRMATVFGIAISVAAAYLVAHWDNIMDVLQMVFAFVNAPLFATFMLGMFWRRATGHGAFFGLLSGTVAAAIHHGLTVPKDAVTMVNGVASVTSILKGGWFHVAHIYPSEMAQGFWTAIFAWSVCFLVTIIVSLLTRQNKSDEDLRGLVYSLTPHVAKDESLHWYAQPATLAVVVLTATVILNIIFW
jgi:solute:Na+ symporter, SSS family